jgi:hypothetical protein
VELGARTRAHWEPRTWNETLSSIAPDRGASDATAAKFPPFQPTRCAGTASSTQTLRECGGGAR